MAAAAKRVTRRELGWVLAWATLVMLTTCVPYFYAVSNDHGRTFGGAIWGVDDVNAHLTWMRQAAAGHVFFRNQYSVAPENPLFFNLFLQLGGRLSALFHTRPVIILHVLRFLGGIWLLLTFYLLAAELTTDRFTRWAALVLASVGSGLGWLVVLGNGLWGLRPIDVGVAWQIQPEAVTYLSLLISPLFVFSMALMCLVFLYALRAFTHDNRRAAVAAGVMLLLLGNIHTYDFFPVNLALALWLATGLVTRQLAPRIAVRNWLIIVLIGLPSVAWSVYATYSDPSFLSKGLTPTLAFRFVDYAAGYGLIGLLALAGAVWTARKKSYLWTLPVCWAASNILVLFLPVSFQRKMIEGLHLALSLLAGLALAAIAGALMHRLAQAGKLQQVRERTVLVLIGATVLTMPSNLLFAAEMIARINNNNAPLIRVMQPPLYLEPADVAAMQWLSTHSRRDDVILSSSFMGSYIPTYCPAKVWVGHWAESFALVTDRGVCIPPQAGLQAWRLVKTGQVHRTNFSENLAVAEQAFRATDPQALLDILHRYCITMVYYGLWEESLAAAGEGKEEGLDNIKAWQSSAASVLHTVYQAGGVTIYRVPAGPGR